MSWALGPQEGDRECPPFRVLLLQGRKTSTIKTSEQTKTEVKEWRNKAIQELRSILKKIKG